MKILPDTSSSCCKPKGLLELLKEKLLGKPKEQKEEQEKK